MNKVIIILISLSLTSSLFAEEVTIEFLFTHTAQVTTSPQLSEENTRMEVTFDTIKKTGKLRYYSNFSNSVDVYDVSVKPAKNGIHFIHEKDSGIAILSFGLQKDEASYSNSSVMYGVLTSYQLYGNGRLLEKR
tara:strand:+ start:616 stop:1017 length:402 start_codon:yes stop_codon:yes gene_type:complete